MKEHNSQPTTDLSATYDSYYASNEYHQRYPRPNIGTLAFLERYIIGQCEQILDVGCGDGRYAIPILQRSDAYLIGCDISAAALHAFQNAATKHAIKNERFELLHSSVTQIDKEKFFDAILMIFGVLSHIKNYDERIAMLRNLRRLAQPGCKLVLSVPSIWRRRPWDLLASVFNQEKLPWGDIHFNRKIAGKNQVFPYHLYSVNSLKNELAQAGWCLVACEAESLLPESQITQYNRLGKIDRLAQRLLPASLGYGIRGISIAS